jgi:hypothetical protein
VIKFLRKTSLYLFAIPLLAWGLGAASNQAVIMSNHDRFPVMWNVYKVMQYDVKLHNELKNKDPEIVQEAKLDIVALEEGGFLDDLHCVMTSKTHLNFLADVFDLHEATYSIGDFLILAAEWFAPFAPFIFIFDVVRKLRKD